MKKIVYILGFITTIGFSQNITDALLFSTEFSKGTARYNAMSGAFGALGGDLSAINNNPAGSAVLQNSLFVGSMQSMHVANDLSYFNSPTESAFTSLSINQLGGALVLHSYQKDAVWKKIVLAANYQETNNFGNDYTASGVSDTSINTYFLNYADGLPFSAIQALPGEYLEEAYLNIGAQYGFAYQQAFLGYYGGIIDPVDDTNPTNALYVGTADFSTVQQDYFYASSGANTKTNINFSTQYKDDLYLGASLNWNTVFSERLTRIYETGYAEDSALEFVSFDTYLKTTGKGFSFQFGAIKKVGKNLRLGVSIQSPTWTRLTDQLSQKINSNLADTDIGYIGKNQVNVFEPYTLRAPAKYTGSVAYVFGKRALLSLDYNYKDYQNIKMKPNYDFSAVNTTIKNSLVGASSLRVGGEYRVDKWSLRGGYHFEESPYKDLTMQSDLSGYSFGFGYHFPNMTLDFSYSRSMQDKKHQLFDVGLINKANVSATESFITATLVYKL